MGWAYCGTDSDGRDIGYGVEAECDEDGCNQQIDRGLAYVCGGMHGEGNCAGNRHDETCPGGCGKYFCSWHLYYISGHAQMCDACSDALDPDEDEEGDLDG